MRILLACFLVFPLLLPAQRKHPYDWWLKNNFNSLVTNKVRVLKASYYSGHGEEKKQTAERIMVFKKPGVLESLLYVSIRGSRRDSIQVKIDKKGVMQGYQTYKQEEGKKVVESSFEFFYDAEGSFSNIEYKFGKLTKKAVIHYRWGEPGGRDSLRCEGDEGHYFPKLKIQDLDTKGRIVKVFQDGELITMYDFGKQGIIRSHRKAWGSETASRVQAYSYHPNGLLEKVEPVSTEESGYSFSSLFSYEFFK